MKKTGFIHLSLYLIFIQGLHAQGTLYDYQRAEKFLPQNLQKRVYNLNVSPNWIEGTSKFWYRSNHRDGKTFWLVDGEKGQKSQAFDHNRLASSLSEETGQSISSNDLPFDRIVIFSEGQKIQFQFDEKTWHCELDEYGLTPVKKEGGKAGRYESLSPNGQWVAFVKNYNLFVRNTVTGEEIQLSSDGIEGFDYATPAAEGRKMVRQGTMDIRQKPDVVWSPDSKKLATYRADRRGVKNLHVIQSVPPEGIRPRLYSMPYPLSGDTAIIWAKPIIFDIENRQQINVDSPPDPVLFWDVYPGYAWFDDGSGIYWTEQSRAYRDARLLAADAKTGKSRTVFTETDDDYVNRGLVDAIPINNGKEFLWASERDGWNHYFLLEGKTGNIKNQVTCGPWFTRYVVRLDEKSRRVFFMACGREKGRDPYLAHLYSIGLDGKGIKCLTPEEGDHYVRFSPDGKTFIDTYSKVDVPPVTVLRRSSDGKVVLHLETADIQDLQALGWTPPEPCRMKARDGKTDIYGIIYRPSNFNKDIKYPVVEYIYTGPHSAFVPKTFSRELRFTGAAIAELGFIVVQIDGMGTGRRSRAFHEVAHKNLQDGGLEDHIAGLRQLAKRYSYMDLDRVGIYGFSAGGYDVVNAMLRFPDFYKVGFSCSGNHDHRMDKADWNEMWMSYPIGDHYDQQSNITRAHRLKGKLFLAHGELDDNVNPFATMRLVNALIEANKDFEFLIMPNMYHYLDESPYIVRKRWDYFVKHLLCVDPPLEYQIENF